MKKKSKKSSFWNGVASVWTLENFVTGTRTISCDVKISLPDFGGFQKDYQSLQQDARKARTRFLSEPELKEA